MFHVNRRYGKAESHKTSDTKHKTVTRTFRISREWDEVLREDAERQGISVNVLINLILRRYANFDRLCRNRNFICMSKRTFRKVIEGMPLEHLALVGENTGSEDVQKTIDMLGLPSNYNSFTYLVREHFGGPNCAMWFNCFRHKLTKHDLFHLQHDLGREWSVFLEKYLLSYLKSLKIDYETKIYDFAVNIRVPRPY